MGICQSCLCFTIILLIPLAKGILKRINRVLSSHGMNAIDGIDNIRTNLPEFNYTRLHQDIDFDNIIQGNTEKLPIPSEIEIATNMDNISAMSVIQMTYQEYPIFYLHLILFPALLSVFKLLTQLEILSLNIFSYYDSELLLFIPYYLAIYFVFTISTKDLRLPMRIIEILSGIFGTYYGLVAFDFIYRIKIGMAAVFLVFDLLVLAVQIKMKWIKDEMLPI